MVSSGEYACLRLCLCKLQNARIIQNRADGDGELLALRRRRADEVGIIV